MRRLLLVANTALLRARRPSLMRPFARPLVAASRGRQVRPVARRPGQLRRPLILARRVGPETRLRRLSLARHGDTLQILRPTETIGQSRTP